jgi:Outer membrane protein beta-barrel domain
MNTATVLKALGAPPAVLACLVWVLLVGALRAGDAVSPRGETSSFNQGSEESSPLLDEPPHPDSAMSDGATARATDEAVSGMPATEAIAWPPADSAVEEPRWSRMWRWVPMGMVPYIGPRTPDCQKDRGIGQPLPGNGWRTNPFSITTFAGFTDGGALIPGHLNQQPSFYGGINLGWDFDHYWGIEKRLGFGALNLTNGDHQPIPTTGLSVTGEYRLMYYPLGEARWRPFLTAGVGWSDFYFMDDHGANHLDTVGMIPFGVGMKYLINNRFALRVDLIDEMTFGGGALSNFHYAALTVGLEFRYGHRLINMPWHRN